MEFDCDNFIYFMCMRRKEIANNLLIISKCHVKSLQSRLTIIRNSMAIISKIFAVELSEITCFLKVFKVKWLC